MVVSCLSRFRSHIIIKIHKGISLLSLGNLRFIIKLITTKKFDNRQENLRATEVVLIIACKENQLDMVKDFLWENHTLGVRKLSLES